MSLRTMGRPSRRPLTGAATLLVAAACAPAAFAGGVDTSWQNDLGGSFFDLANWDIAVPGLLDTAIFDISGTYTVSVPGAAVHELLSFDEGEALFDLTGGSYSVAGMVVGDRIRDIGLLDLAGGTMSVSSTGTDFVRVGKDLGAIGVLDVGTGATLSSSEELLIGDGGNGTVDVNGTLSSFRASIGDDPTGVGVVRTVASGATWTNSNNLTIGNFGSGTIEVAPGTSVTIGGLTRLGDELGSSGAISISGSGALLELNAETFVGDLGTGTMTVSNGGVADTTRVKIGDEIGSTGMATVTGTGSSWTDSVEIFVGNFGTGTLDVTAGGAVSGAAATIADDPGSMGTATVSGAGSSWSSSGAMRLGDLGTGLLHVESGATADAASISIGIGLGSAGTATVAGAGSRITSTGSLNAAGAGSSTLRVHDGGQIQVGTTLTLGADAQTEAVIGSAWVDGIVVTGTATIGGTVDVALAPGFSPAAGSTFVLVAPGALAGTYSTINAPTGLDVLVSGGQVIIQVVGAPCAGDVDGTGDVGFADLLAVLASWGPCVGCPEDIDGDDIVGFADLLGVLAAWGPCP